MYRHATIRATGNKHTNSKNEYTVSAYTHLQWPFVKFVDSPYFSESELCGCAVMVSFSKYLSLGKRCTSYNAPPTSRKRAPDSLSLRNFLLGAPFSSLEKPRYRMGRNLNWILCSTWKKWIGGTPSEHPPYSPHVAPMRFLGFSNHEKGAPRQEISKWSTVCSTFSRSGWSVVRSASLAKWGKSKKRPSPHPYKVPTRGNMASPRTFQTALVYTKRKSKLLQCELEGFLICLKAKSRFGTLRLPF
jgi:hypothetical protein